VTLDFQTMKQINHDKSEVDIKRVVNHNLWYWQDDDGLFKEYNEDILLLFENAFKTRQLEFEFTLKRKYRVKIDER